MSPLTSKRNGKTILTCLKPKDASEGSDDNAWVSVDSDEQFEHRVTILTVVFESESDSEEGVENVGNNRKMS